MAFVVIAGLVLPCVGAGYGILQLAGPKSLRLGMVDGLFVCGLTGMLTLGWLALVLAEVGLFSALVILFSGLASGGLGWWAARRRGTRVTFDKGEWRKFEIVFLIGLIALTALLYLRPHEFIFGGADAGVYVNLGANISRTGRWLIANPDFSALPPEDYGMFFREQPPNQLPRRYHLPGFYVADDDAGDITPQFYPLHPVWLAIAHGLGGVRANLLMTPLWGILGVLAFYLAVRETFEARTAAAAAVLLALTPTQIWFARYPTAEALTQFLFFGGLYAFARHVRRGENGPAVLAGLALGQVMLARVDTYFVLGVLVLYAAYLHLRRRLDWRFGYLALPMLSMSAHSFLHAWWQGWPYFYNSLWSGSAVLPVPPLAMLGGLILAVVAFAVFDRLVARRPGWEAQAQPIWNGLMNILAIGLALLALYAYFVLPLRADVNQTFFYWYAQHTIPNVEPYNLVRLGWYLSPLGVGLGVVGIVLIVRRQVTERTWLMVGLGVFFSLLYIYRTFNNPHHIYVMRRYVPVVIPTFALGAAYVLNWLADKRRLGRVLAIGLALAQAGLLLYADRIVVRQVDYQGGLDQFQSFSAPIPPRAVVVFNNNEPVGVTAIVGTPLAYLEGYSVLDLQEDRTNADRLDALAQRWLATGRPLVVIDGPSRVSGLCDRWTCRALGAARFDLPLLEASYEHFPVTINRWQFTLDLYQVESVD